jgi:hypothetical protein
MPFAVLSSGVSLDANHLKVFRNAQPDSATENGTDTYLFGTIREEDQDTNGYIWWSGGVHIRFNKGPAVRNNNQKHKFHPCAGFGFD